jgi:SepF-like predicted cell division protein (DUF552 family)
MNLIEPRRMDTIEPFSIKKPFESIADVGKNVGGSVADVGKNVGGSVADVGKNVGGLVVDVGKNVGGKVADVGKTVWKAVGPVFEKIWEILKMLFGNWKLMLCLIITCVLCSFLSPVLMPMMTVFSVFK